MFIGFAIILIGVIFLLQNLGLISANVWQVIWPVLIILLGLSIISKNSCQAWKWEVHRDEPGDRVRRNK
ncbi:MAG: DUF5668 domain-containing protein [Candidatus Paceibacterota bacterium]|jgi:hypothetical protein